MRSRTLRVDHQLPEKRNQAHQGQHGGSNEACHPQGTERCEHPTAQASNTSDGFFRLRQLGKEATDDHCGRTPHHQHQCHVPPQDRQRLHRAWKRCGQKATVQRAHFARIDQTPGSGARITIPDGVGTKADGRSGRTVADGITLPPLVLECQDDTPLEPERFPLYGLPETGSIKEIMPRQHALHRFRQARGAVSFIERTEKSTTRADVLRRRTGNDRDPAR
jgi:hypothetical protein